MLLPTYYDDDSGRVPDGLLVVDAHVHLFPPRLFEAIWRWFDAHGWKIRYRLHAEEVIAHLVERGVTKVVGLLYAHKEGMARSLNAWMAELQSRHRDRVLALGTVFPGEPDAPAIVDEALALGLRGLKLHCHVQRVAADDARLDPVYARCAAAGAPIVIHCGSAPALDGYGFDVRAIAGAERVGRVLERHPSLTLVVPHLGADEGDGYARLLDRFERLYLDTTMAVGGYFRGARVPVELIRRHPSRILYGTDFPNLPFAWNRELRAILDAPLDDAERRAVMGGNALTLFDAGPRAP